jgi:hypothetical protein
MCRAATREGSAPRTVCCASSFLPFWDVKNEESSDARGVGPLERFRATIVPAPRQNRSRGFHARDGEHVGLSRGPRPAGRRNLWRIRRGCVLFPTFSRGRASRSPVAPTKEGFFSDVIADSMRFARPRPF